MKRSCPRCCRHATSYYVCPQPTTAIITVLWCYDCAMHSHTMNENTAKQQLPKSLLPNNNLALPLVRKEATARDVPGIVIPHEVLFCQLFLSCRFKDAYIVWISMLLLLFCVWLWRCMNETRGKPRLPGNFQLRALSIYGKVGAGPDEEKFWKKSRQLQLFMERSSVFLDTYLTPVWSFTTDISPLEKACLKYLVL